MGPGPAEPCQPPRSLHRSCPQPFKHTSQSGVESRREKVIPVFGLLESFCGLKEKDPIRCSQAFNASPGQREVTSTLCWGQRKPIFGSLYFLFPRTSVHFANTYLWKFSETQCRHPHHSDSGVVCSLDVASFYY